MGEDKHKYPARCTLFTGLKLQTWRYCVVVRLHKDTTFHMGEDEHKYRARCTLFTGLKLQTWRYCVVVRVHITNLNFKPENFSWKL